MARHWTTVVGRVAALTSDAQATQRKAARLLVLVLVRSAEAGESSQAAATKARRASATPAHALEAVDDAEHEGGMPKVGGGARKVLNTKEQKEEKKKGEKDLEGENKIEKISLLPIGVPSWSRLVSSRLVSTAAMNQSFLNPFSTPAIPESVHQVIAPTTDFPCLCARFNPRGLYAGQYIASARTDAGIAIYDLETCGTLRFLEGHVKPVTSIAWSDTGRFLASSSTDWNVVLWDLKPQPAARVRTIRFDASVTSVSFCPGSSRLLLVVLESQQVVLVDLRRRRRAQQTTPVNGQHANGTASSILKNGSSSSSSSSSSSWQTYETRIDLSAVHDLSSPNDPLPPITCAKFHPSGAYIFAGTTRGEVLVFSVVQGGQLVARKNVSGASAVREIAIDRAGRNLVTNSNDRCIRIVGIELAHPPEKTPSLVFDTSTSASTAEWSEDQVRLTVLHRFQDLVNRTPWNGIGFSGDGEYVFAGAAHKAAHNLYVWDRNAGALDKILEGPREPLVDADWHPIRPLLLSVSVSGSINIWFTPNAENWSAYDPGFVELEENIEYQEAEDEFDLVDEEEVERRKQDEEEAGDVDLLTVGALPGDVGAKGLKWLSDPASQGVDPRLPRKEDECEEMENDEQDKWEYEWEHDPETLGEDLAIYVNLEEDDMDEDALGVGGGPGAGGGEEAR